MTLPALTSDDRFVIGWDFAKDGVWIPVWGTPEYIRVLMAGAYVMHGGQGSRPVDSLGRPLKGPALQRWAQAQNANGSAPTAKNGAAGVAPVAAANTAVAVAGVGNGGLTADELTEAGVRLFDAGHHPTPLGRKNGDKPNTGKIPWFKKLTGYNGVDVTSQEQIAAWPNKIAWLCQQKGAEGIRNIGIRMAADGIGVDVDGYDDKRGLTTLAELETRLGPLPVGFRVTARGFACGSGIRLFRIPEGVLLRTELKAADGANGHIEIIQRHHRVAAMPPSVHHTGTRYAIYDERTGEAIDDLPPTGEWPELPDAWVEYLRVDGEAKAGRRAPAAPEEVARFAKEHTASAHPKLAAAVVNRIREARVDTRNIVRDGLKQGARESRGGWYPWAAFCADMLAAADESYAARGEGEFDRDDFARLVADAVAKANAEDADALMARLEDRLAAANGWADVETMKMALNGDRPASRSMADIKPAAVRWLWKGYLPLGKVSMFEGDPDVGKSTLTIDWTATVSTGRAWPDTVIGGNVLVSKHDPAGVLLVGVEDDPEDTVVPRLMAAGADLSRVRYLNRPVDKGGKPVPFTIPDDIEWLRKGVREADAKLVIIDPITACLPDDTKHGVDASIRKILTHLAVLAEELDCAILLIRHHNKSAGMSAKHRGGGSIAYTALARSVITAAKVPDSMQSPDGAMFAIARAKGNLSKPPAAIGYLIEDAPEIEGLPEPEDDELRIGVIRYCGVVEDLDADTLVGAGAVSKDARKTAPLRDDAMDKLRELLADGPMESGEATRKVMKAVQCSKDTVVAAKKKLDVVSRSVRTDDNKKVDHWTWQLPVSKSAEHPNISVRRASDS